MGSDLLSHAAASGLQALNPEPSADSCLCTQPLSARMSASIPAAISYMNTDDSNC